MEKFIVMEGLDGAGKSTQIELLKNYLDRRNIEYRYIHFPQTDYPANSPVYGDMVANFLKGEYGDIKQVNPYLVALLYAGDRYNAGARIREWLEAGYFVLLDRYVYSNMAFQGAKFSRPEEKQELRRWIEHLEYEYHRIPKPVLSIFLRMPFDFVRRKLADTRKGTDRTYLDGKDDIHESSLEFQEKVEKEYLQLVEENNDFHLINCFDGSGKTLSPGEIHQKVTALLIEKGML
jgi:dTMP kinase